jgi:predicted adenine nucleotide alpha hydrolase (AANH) superfamily ATPase
MENRSNRLLIHCCCAPCSSAALLHLKERFELTFFFYNPNIFPKDEYEKRKEEIIRISEKENIPLIIGNYNHIKWLKSASIWEDEPEKGRRCIFCYNERLTETAIYSDLNGFDFFSSTLTLSPHKDADIINKLGNEISKKYSVNYFETNLKKKGGYDYSIRYSKENCLFRQNYCGCELSQHKKRQESPKE